MLTKLSEVDFHTEIQYLYHYLSSRKYPDNCSENFKRSLRKRALSFEIEEDTAPNDEEQTQNWRMYHVPPPGTQKAQAAGGGGKKGEGDAVGSGKCRARRLVISHLSEQHKLMEKAHLGPKGLHHGRDRMIKALGKKYYWRRIIEMIAAYPKSCGVCIQSRQQSALPKSTTALRKREKPSLQMRLRERKKKKRGAKSDLMETYCGLKSFDDVAFPIKVHLIYTYLSSRKYPASCTQSFKRALRRAATSYSYEEVVGEGDDDPTDWRLFYIRTPGKRERGEEAEEEEEEEGEGEDGQSTSRTSQESEPVKRLVISDSEEQMEVIRAVHCVGEDGQSTSRTSQESEPVKRLVISDSEEQMEVIRAVHCVGETHLGRDKTSAKATKFYYWKNMYRDIDLYIKSCRPCKLKKIERKIEKKLPAKKMFSPSCPAKWKPNIVAATEIELELPGADSGDSPEKPSSDPEPRESIDAESSVGDEIGGLEEDDDDDDDDYSDGEVSVNKGAANSHTQTVITNTTDPGSTRMLSPPRQEIKQGHKKKNDVPGSNAPAITKISDLSFQREIEVVVEYMKHRKYPPNTSNVAKRSIRAKSKLFFLREGEGAGPRWGQGWSLFYKSNTVREEEEECRLVVPLEADQQLLLWDIHTSWGKEGRHCARDRMRQYLCSFFYWRKMYDDIRIVLQSCKKCNALRQGDFTHITEVPEAQLHLEVLTENGEHCEDQERSVVIQKPVEEELAPILVYFRQLLAKEESLATSNKDKTDEMEVLETLNNMMNRAEPPPDPNEGEPTEGVNSTEVSNGKEPLVSTQPSTPSELSGRICPLCHRVFRRVSHLRDHKCGDRSTGCHTCEICGKTFRSKHGLIVHEVVHTHERPHKCHICKKDYRYSRSLRYHLKMHEGVRPFCCKPCKKTFLFRSELTFHMREKHGGVGEFTCGLCSKTFHRRGQLNLHVKNHNKVPQSHPCPVCHKSLHSSTTLKQHMRIHTGERPFLCDVCGKGFRVHYDMVLHRERHFGVRKYKCEVCDKRYALKKDLECHMNVHTGGVMYECDQCHKQFRNSRSLDRCKRRHRAAAEENKVSFQCDSCGEKFKSGARFAEHMEKHIAEQLLLVTFDS